MNEVHFQSSVASLQTPYTQRGLIFTRRFTTEGVSPYDELQWEQRTRRLRDSKGKHHLRAEER